MNQSIVHDALAILARSQVGREAARCVTGEFPMVLRCPEPRQDFNFLTGYATLHLAAARRDGALSSATLDQLLDRARDVPSAYRTARGTLNWYRPTASGAHAPHDFDWPKGRVLSLHDDLDDTAIAVLLGEVDARFRPRAPITRETFAPWTYEPATHPLRPKARRRLELAGVDRGVFLSWAIDDAASERIPVENSVELVTAANAWTAMRLLGATTDARGMSATRTFVNASVRIVVERLLAGDPTYAEFFAPYYPRVPFAPVAYLLRNHVWTGGALFDGPTLWRIAEAVERVEPTLNARGMDFAALAFWMNAVGWAAAAGIVGGGCLDRWRRVGERAGDQFDAERGGWPDFVFFQAAHIGDYGGRAYSNALMVETLALLERYRA